MRAKFLVRLIILHFDRQINILWRGKIWSCSLCCVFLSVTASLLYIQTFLSRSCSQTSSVLAFYEVLTAFPMRMTVLCVMLRSIYAPTFRRNLFLSSTMIIQAEGYSEIPVRAGRQGVSSDGSYLHHQCKCFPFGGRLNLTPGQNKGQSNKQLSCTWWYRHSELPVNNTNMTTIRTDVSDFTLCAELLVRQRDSLLQYWPSQVKHRSKADCKVQLKCDGTRWRTGG